MKVKVKGGWMRTFDKMKRERPLHCTAIWVVSSSVKGGGVGEGEMQTEE